MSDQPIYLDHNATTPMLDEVREAMLPFLSGGHGNPSSGHAFGREARRAVDAAREEVASYLGVSPTEIIFTSGGTEGNNLAIKGLALGHLARKGAKAKGKRIVISAIEHPSVVEPALWLERTLGFEVVRVGVDETGTVDLDELSELVNEDCILVSIMHAHNEVGTVQPILDLVTTVADRGPIFHCDGAQACGKIPTGMPLIGVSAYTIAGHKLYGPKGVGVLRVRRGLPIEPLLHGAGHESGRRGGTENTAGVVGLAAAMRAARRDMAFECERVHALRDLLHALLVDEVPGLAVNGHPTRRLPNTLNVSFPGCLGPAVAEAAGDVVAFSTGPACHDRGLTPTPFFEASGLGAERAASSVRLALGKSTTEDAVRAAAKAIGAAARSVRGAAGIPDSFEGQPGVKTGPECNRCDGRQVLHEKTEHGPALRCDGCGHERLIKEATGELTCDVAG